MNLDGLGVLFCYDIGLTVCVTTRNVSNSDKLYSLMWVTDYRVHVA